VPAFCPPVFPAFTYIIAIGLKMTIGGELDIARYFAGFFRILSLK